MVKSLPAMVAQPLFGLRNLLCRLKHQLPRLSWLRQAVIPYSQVRFLRLRVFEEIPRESHAYCRNLIKKPWAFIKVPYMNPTILGL